MEKQQEIIIKDFSFLKSDENDNNYKIIPGFCQ